MVAMFFRIGALSNEITLWNFIYSDLKKNLFLVGSWVLLNFVIVPCQHKECVFP